MYWDRLEVANLGILFFQRRGDIRHLSDLNVVLNLLIAINNDNPAIFAFEVLLLVLLELLLLLVVLAEQGFNGCGLVAAVLLELG